MLRVYTKGRCYSASKNQPLCTPLLINHFAPTPSRIISCNTFNELAFVLFYQGHKEIELFGKEREGEREVGGGLKEDEGNQLNQWVYQDNYYVCQEQDNHCVCQEQNNDYVCQEQDNDDVFQKQDIQERNTDFT